MEQEPQAGHRVRGPAALTRAGLPRWVPATIWGASTLFAAAVVAMAAALIARERSEAVEQGLRHTGQAVSSAEATMNRTLLAIDVFIAGAEALVRRATSGQGGVDLSATQQLLSALVKGNLLVREMALLSEGGAVLASSQPSGQRMGFSLPEGFRHELLTQRLPALAVSQPAEQFRTADTVIYFGRQVALAGGDKGMLVGVVPTSTLESVLAPAVSVDGMSIALEREDGRLYVSVPLSGLDGLKRLTQPLPPDRLDGQPRQADARTDNYSPTFTAARAMVYPGLLVVAAVPHEAVMANWKASKRLIASAASAFVLLLLATAAAIHWQWIRLARTRRQVLESGAWLDEAFQSIRDGLLLCDQHDKVVTWNQRYLEYFPSVKGMLRRGCAFEALIRASARDVRPGASQDELNSWVDQRMLWHRDGSAEFEHLASKQRILHVTETAIPGGGRVTVFRDITATERELDQAKRAAQVEIEARTQHLNALGAGISGPVNSILGIVSILSDKPLAREEKTHIDRMHASGMALLLAVRSIIEKSEASQPRGDPAYRAPDDTGRAGE